MSRWWQLIVAVVAGLLIGSAGTWLIAGAGREQVAVVDVERVFAESKMAKDYNAKLKQEAEERRESLTKVPSAQRAQKSAEFTKELEKLQGDYRAELLKSLDGVLAGLAKRYGLDAIYVKGSVMRYGRLDLTDEVLEKMK